ncbi:extracellular solute-binding protein [Nonomuraea roseoviolacea subsp. roseoviolacea]|uniref:Multiple sugar transport system substrate-binding protein n=1 Tax=Nonomuraea roseoviolacea subsp. carminata TaxID=160689 RepID=A0ABT1JTY2_9ACTN|nr:extracellular solute-binding protein [Nonomuraea roseoviolacea]MCP2345211.1 multiple sugar transport system substrate-binding protein [Nonomuraea roseoviolacea subsp. carminata]
MSVVAVLAASGLTLTACGGSSGDGGGGGTIELTIAQNAIAGGKNARAAEFIADWVIPKFEAAQKAKGKDVKVKFVPSGVDDEQYKTKLSLDLKSGKGADVIDIDGIWAGEFAEAGYIKPLSELVGPEADSWDGWAQIPEAVQGLATYNGKKYALPIGTDGRVLYFSKPIFQKAGLPADWQPKSWQEVLDTAAKLKAAGVPVPIQINAGTAMGEATTMQGVLPLLAGAGAEIQKDGKWAGASQPVKDVLGLYQKIYGGSGLGDPRLQQEAKGRDKSFQQFASGKIGILLEGDYFWRGVVNPKDGVAKMADRDQSVGYAMIPAIEPGKGIRGQDFVSMSGGALRTVNPNSKHPKEAFELLAFTLSPEALKEETKNGNVRITPRTDVNKEILAGEPLLTFISEKVLPLTAYRPPVAVYPQVSVALQEATAAVVGGKTPDEAATAYQQKLEGLVGGAGNIAS